VAWRRSSSYRSIHAAEPTKGVSSGRTGKRRAWSVGLFWLASWFFLFLELFGFHHVTRAVLFESAAWFDTQANTRSRGRFWTTVAQGLLCSRPPTTGLCSALFSLFYSCADRKVSGPAYSTSKKIIAA